MDLRRESLLRSFMGLGLEGLERAFVLLDQESQHRFQSEQAIRVAGCCSSKRKRVRLSVIS